MKRRDFIAAVGSATAAIALPFAVRAQQQKLRRVVWMDRNPFRAPIDNPFMRAFKTAMRDLGYIEGQNVAIEISGIPDGNFEKLREFAEGVVASQPDVIFAPGTEVAVAARRATTSIPIVVAVVNDPVATGLATSLARPGGNVTGLTSANAEITTKSVELIHLIVPDARRVSVLMSNNPAHPVMLRHVTDAARSYHLEIVAVYALSPDDRARAFAEMRRQNCQALIVLADPQIAGVAELAAEYRLPAIYQTAAFVDLGGLVSYAASFPDLFRRAAGYVDKILKGAKPADLPIEQPTRFELVVNLKTAKTLGLQIPESFLLRADRVVE